MQATKCQYTESEVYPLGDQVVEKRNDVWSATFSVNFGVRQGSVLSPFLFNIYLDDVAKLNDCVNRKFIIVYADDILLIAQSVPEFRNLLRACEKELITIDMKINVKKSCCMRVYRTTL